MGAWSSSQRGGVERRRSETRQQRSVGREYAHAWRRQHGVGSRSADRDPAVSRFLGEHEVADEFCALREQDRVARLCGVQRLLKIVAVGNVDGRGGERLYTAKPHGQD